MGFFARYKERAYVARWNKGYAHAMRTLSADHFSGEDQILGFTERSRDFGEFDEFDRGALEALGDWRQIVINSNKDKS